jgi:putative glutamine amidotransferase
MTIAITPYIYLNKYNKICFSINKEWSGFVSKLNSDILMLCDYSRFRKIVSGKEIKAVVLSGGGDISKINDTKINKLRDNFEVNLTKYCFKKKIPIIAVCRGFQLLAAKEGCKLKKNKETSNSHSINVKVKGNDKNLKVNSFHKYKIFNLNSNFDILGKCKDGSIEIASHKTKKLLCFMMHPERPGNDKFIFKMIQSFIK